MQFLAILESHWLQPWEDVKGYKCPICGSEGPFLMDSKSRLRWSDEGTDSDGNFDQFMEMDPDGQAVCEKCKHTAPVAEFNVEKMYVENGGNYCPYCENEDLEGDSVTIENNKAWQEMRCNKCNAGWIDVYTLSGLGDYPDPEFLKKE